MSICSADNGLGRLPSRNADRRITMSREAPETIRVTTRHVSCDGGGGALGHPLVYYRIPEETGWVECGYCDRRFILDDGAHRHPAEGVQSSTSHGSGATSGSPRRAGAKD